MRPVDRANAAAVAPPPGGKRILVLFEAGRAGVAAVEQARELAEREGATVTVVSHAPQAPRMRGCVPSANDYNAAVRDSVARDLARAEELLWSIGSRADCRLLVEGVDPTLEELVWSERFDLVLLPARRRFLRALDHPAAPRLRSRARASEIRIVAA
jgi:nucleotide-binding universal stress UspA family protein